MAYKYSKGEREFGDIEYENDAQKNTKLDFDEDYIALQTGGNNTLVVSGSSVGIGTTSPAETLHVAGNLKVAGDDVRVKIDGDTDSHPGVELYENGTRKWIVFNDYTNDNLTFKTNSATRMSIEQDGNVGIGTTSPDYTLHVAGDIGVDQYIRHNSNPNTHVNFTDDKIVLKAGNKAMVTMEEKGSAPHEITLNDGSNNIDFVVKGNGSGQGNPGMKFDASTNRLGINGVGTPDKALHVGGSMKLDGTQSTIFFADGNTEKAEIGINSSDNILIENKTMNKHIVFKVNDQGVVREGLRLDGAVPEVVVNQSSDSLVDFRVESDNQTHMLYVSGGVDRVGISTGTPHSGLQIDNSVAFAARAITQNHTVTAVDHTIFANATSTNITVTLPTAANIMGRQYIIKRVDSSGNNVTIDPDGSETIEGASSMILDSGRSVVIQSDNSNWWIVAEYISPP